VSGKGHLDSWCGLISKVLSDRGYKIFILTPGVTEAGFVHSQDKTSATEIEYLKWKISVAERLRLTAISALSRLPRILNFLIKARQRRRDRPLGQAQSRRSSGDVHPKSFEFQVNWAMRRRRVNPDLILNLYLDVYRSDALSWKNIKIDNNTPFVGLRFVGDDKGIDGVCTANGFKGIALFEEDMYRKYSARYENLKVVQLPDVTNTNREAMVPNEIKQLQKLADGRTIVFFGGAIGGNKNIGKFVEVISMMDPNHWFFIVIGKVDKTTFTEFDLVEYNKIESGMFKNVLLIDQYIESELIFNEYICASDIIYAVYRNFEFSSNMLMKASSFHKPIVVSDRYAMGRRVKIAEIGYTTDEDDKFSISRGLILALEKPINPERFLEYNEINSEYQFGELLQDFVGEYFV
jgi:glycosyltransferase involved in cell wall biosynthesis